MVYLYYEFGDVVSEYLTGQRLLDKGLAPAERKPRSAAGARAHHLPAASSAHEHCDLYGASVAHNGQCS